MRRRLAGVILSAGALWVNDVQGELNTDDYASQIMVVQSISPDQEEDNRPFSVSLTVDGTGKADFEHEHCKKKLKNVQFAIAELEGTGVFYYNPACHEGLFATLGYTYTLIDWKNPYVDQNNFNTVSFGMGGFSKRLSDWTWQGQVVVNADVTHFEFADYFTFNMILAGRYAYNPCLGLHVGLIVLTGYRIDHVYPIVGVDWKISDKWWVNAVFPLNVSLLYKFTDRWSVEIAGRAYEERHRVGKHNHYSRGLVEYYSTGMELGVNYASCQETVKGNIHIGEGFGGLVKVSDQRHRNGHRFRFKAAPYVGGYLAVKF